MRVSERGKSDNVLVAFHESMVPDAKLVEAAVYRDVPDNDGKAALSLELVQLLFEPFDLLSRILPVFEQPPVQVIASIRVDRDHLASSIECEWFRIVSVFCKSFSLILREPVWTSPIPFDMVNRPV